jgi:hypothetical protein
MKKLISKINRDFQKITKMICGVFRFAANKVKLKFHILKLKYSKRRRSEANPISKSEFNSWLDNITKKAKPYRKQIGWTAFTIFCGFIIVAGGMFLSSKHSEATGSAVAVAGTTGTIGNTGEKIYFDPGTYASNVTIDNYSRQMAGYAWSADLGWISFGTDSNPSGPVVADTSGHLSGKAKALNGGYIDFNASPTGANVVIASGGNFSGYAWSEDIGWVNFSGVSSPNYNPDLLPPNNPSSITAKSTSSGVTLDPAIWYNYQTPYFSWTAPSDNANGITPSGVAGYYVYFGTNASADPSVWQTTTNYTASDLSTNYNQSYYLRIKTQDVAGNISTAATVYTYKYDQDNMAPPDPTLSSAKSQTPGGSDIVSGDWHNFAAPYFTFNASTDATDGSHANTVSGTAGYYVYFGTSNSADPHTAGSYQTGLNYTAGSLVSGSTYYLRISSKDNAGNIGSGSTIFTYKYETATPDSPKYVSVSPSGFTRTNSFTFIWPTSGADMASDTGGSGIYGYQYKTGTTDGVYSDWSATMTGGSLELGDVAYRTGTNIFYLRAVDNAGNVDPTPVQTNFYYNNTAPTAPKNLIVTPSSSDSNSFAFSWDEPSTGSGTISGYYYSINALPTPSNTSFVTDRTLPAGPYATQQGENTFYIVAKDEAGNFSFDSCNAISGNPDTDGCAKTTFTANTTAPGAPASLQIFDISNRDASLFAATLKWIAPVNTGTGFNGYEIYRSTDGSSYSSVGTTAGTTYADTDLTSSKYYYYVKSKDNAGQLSVASSIVNLTPTGRYTNPPALTENPTASPKAFSATISWETDREGSSFGYFSKSKDDLKNAKGFGQPEKSKKHSVEVIGLDPETIYYYQAMWEDADGNQGRSDVYSFKTGLRPKISDVKVSNITLNAATISWTSTTIATSTINYGKTSNYGGNISDKSGSQTTSHSINLTSLDDSATYHFQIIGTDTDNNQLVSDDYTFNTLTMPKISNFRFETVKDAPTTTLKFNWDTNVATTSIVSYTIGSSAQTASQADYKTAHEITVSDLQDKSVYVLKAKGVDSFGNQVESDANTYTTPLDTRPPKLSSLAVEIKSNGFGQTQQAQLVVSWQTDEPSTSQIEYSTGISGSDYDFKTKEDMALSTSHVVIASGLEPSKIYHLRAVSHDNAGNLGTSNDTTTITGKIQQSVVDIIVNSLQKSLGFLSKMFYPNN